MRQNKIHVLHKFFFLLLLCLLGCKKDNSAPIEPTTPPPGEINTMTAKINGGSWNARDSVFGISYIPSAYYHSDGVSSISGQSRKSRSSITIYTYSISEGRYQLRYPGEGYACAYFETFTDTYNTDDGTTFTGYLTISKYDTVSKTIKGTFYFRALILSFSDPKDTVNITDGKFYLKVK